MANARSIEWHERCLRKSESILARTLHNLDALRYYVWRRRRKIEKLRAQIKEAKRCKKDAFDSELFMPGWKPNVTKET